MDRRMTLRKYTSSQFKVKVYDTKSTWDFLNSLFCIERSQKYKLKRDLTGKGNYRIF